MSFKRELPESVVIVRNDHGAVATLRYKTARFDKIISSPSPKKTAIYRAVEAHVLGKEYYGKKEQKDS